MTKKKKILFIHQNFPGQYKFLAARVSHDNKFDVYSLSLNSPDTIKLHELKEHYPKINHHKYSINSKNVNGLNRLAIEFETKMIRAEAVALKALELKDSGLIPDLIIVHPGWGEGFLLKEVWRNAKFLTYFEFFYNTKDSDVDFDLAEENRPEYDFNLRTKLVARNAPFLSSFSQSDCLISPTEFQKNTAPIEYRDKINVIHDGINTNIVKPRDDAALTITKNKEDGIDEQIVLSKKDKVITFVNRNLEPYRGYHIFMRALPDILKEHPDAYILIVGGNSVSYGAQPEKGSYKDLYYNEVKKKLPKGNNILFLGNIQYNHFLNVLGISSLHIYLTYPFVLSWSMLEAMSLECLVLGSKTEPVQEVITNNKNGLLVDFFDFNEISKISIDVLNDPDKYNKLRKAARKTIVDNYDLETVCMPKQLELIERLLK